MPFGNLYLFNIESLRLSERTAEAHVEVVMGCQLCVLDVKMITGHRAPLCHCQAVL
jgi:hypothetical protein